MAANQRFANKAKANAWASGMGYSLQPGDGLVAVDQIAYQTNSPKSGSAWSTVPVYGKAAPAAASQAGVASAPLAGAASGLPAPNDGSYSNVTANLAAQAQQGADVAALYRQKQAEDAAANAKVVADMRAQADTQASALEQLMIKQRAEYDAQLMQQQERLTAAQAEAAEQRRQAAALATAYIPALQPVAQAPALGDARSLGAIAGQGRSSTNLLSTLSILSGVSGGQTGAMSPALVGLQIA